MLRGMILVLQFACLAALLTLLIASLPTASTHSPAISYEICQQNEQTKKEECAAYGLAPFVFIKVFKFLNDYGVAVTALATIAIAWFTLTLRRSTDRLWDAGERQLTHLGGATEKQLRAYISVDTGIYIRQLKRLRFEFRPNIVNNGNTPANNVRVLSRCEIKTPFISHEFDYKIIEVEGAKSVTSLSPRQVKYHNGVATRKATFAEMRKLLKCEYVYHLWGTVFYNDVFDIERRTNFSFLILLPGSKRGTPIWQVTEHHNDAT